MLSNCYVDAFQEYFNIYCMGIIQLVFVLCVQKTCQYGDQCYSNQKKDLPLPPPTPTNNNNNLKYKNNSTRSTQVLKFSCMLFTKIF